MGLSKLSSPVCRIIIEPDGSMNRICEEELVPFFFPSHSSYITSYLCPTRTTVSTSHSSGFQAVFAELNEATTFPGSVACRKIWEDVSLVTKWVIQFSVPVDM